MNGRLGLASLGALMVTLVALAAPACSKSDGSPSPDAGADGSSGGPGDGASDAAKDTGADARACLPPGETCQTTCCPPAACVKPSGGVGTCCLPLGTTCTVATDCCVQPGIGNTICAPGDGGLVCTFQAN